MKGRIHNDICFIRPQIISLSENYTYLLLHTWKCVRVTDVTEPTRIKAPGLKRLLPPSAPFPDSRTLPGPEDELHNLLSKIILN